MDKKDKNKVNIYIKEGTSKKGNQYECLAVQIGDYETLIFPSKVELAYIKSCLQ